MKSDIERVVADLQIHLQRNYNGDEWRGPVPAIICPDGSIISVQASQYHRCSPSQAVGPWTQVEVMTMSADFIAAYWDNIDGDPSNYVPIEDVAKELLSRGCLGAPFTFKNQGD